MKRSAPIILTALLLALLLQAFAACGGKQNNDPSPLPKMASDEEVVKMWDEYPALDGLPRFKEKCILDGFYPGEDGMVVASFLGVSAEAFEGYCASLTGSGYKLKEGSSIWLTEGITGMPQFEKGNRLITVVWSAQGTLDISSNLKPAD